MALKNEALRTYATLLQQAGFAIYEPRGESGNYFTYSRIVDGVECFGTVEARDFGGYQHFMPIPPSREHGSSMFVDEVELTVQAARRTASRDNTNHIVGRHSNRMDLRWLEQGYEKWDVLA